jgi:glutathione peroxidase
MKIILTSIFVVLAGFLMAFKRHQKTIKMQLSNQTTKQLYELSYTSIDGEEISLSRYKGKYVMLVNVASKCGYTPQYTQIEKLFEMYKDNLVIIGFPCNQFLGQEPGSESEIAEFCQKNYGVTFPLSSKINVKGKNQHPIYTWLTSISHNQVEDTEVKWNFHKFLISPQGEYLGDFGSGVDPFDPTIVDLIKL